MASTARGRELTEQQRGDQLAVRAALLLDLIALWPLLDPQRLTETTPSWLEQTLGVVLRHRDRSARSAATYYTAFRNAEIGDDDAFVAVPDEADRDVRARITASLLVTGPVEVRKRVAAGQEPGQAARAALVMLSGAAGRHALNGARETVIGAAQNDPRAVGYARVTSGAPCWFCAMLASRGPVYKTRVSAGARASKFVGGGSAAFHDRCACTIEAVYSKDAPWPGVGQEFEQLWKESTKGKSGAAAQKAFREAVEARQTGTQHGDQALDEPPAPAPEQPVPDRQPVDEHPATADPRDVAEMDDDELEDAFAAAAGAEDDAALDALLAEMDRREAAKQDQEDAEASAAEPDEDQLDDVDPAQAEQWQRYEELLNVGYSDEEAFAEAFNRDADRVRREEAIGRLRSQGYQGRNLEELSRAAWRDEVYRRYLAAEDATRGHLLTPQAQRRGVDPLSLFTGPAHVARANASDELKEWWDQHGHGRPTYDQWAELLLGGSVTSTGTTGDGWLR